MESESRPSRNVSIQVAAGTMSAGAGVQSEEEAGKEFWGPLTLGGLGGGRTRGKETGHRVQAHGNQW